MMQSPDGTLLDLAIVKHLGELAACQCRLMKLFSQFSHQWLPSDTHNSNNMKRK